MSLKLKSDREFKRLLESLWTELLLSNTHFLIFLEIKKKGRRHLDEINFAKAFWQMTYDAHIQMTLIGLSKSYDQHRAGFHLNRLVQTVRDNPGVFSVPSVRSRLSGKSDVDELMRDIPRPTQRGIEQDLLLTSDTDPLVKSLKFWRDTVLAHKNPAHVLTAIPLEISHPLPYSRIRVLLNRGFRILNRYSKMFDANTYDSTFFKWNDVGFVLHALRYHPSVVRMRRDRRFIRSSLQHD